MLDFSAGPSLPRNYFLTCALNVWYSECIIMMSQHSNRLATTTAIILVHNEYDAMHGCHFHGKRHANERGGGGGGGGE